MWKSMPFGGVMLLSFSTFTVMLIPLFPCNNFPFYNTSRRILHTQAGAVSSFGFLVTSRTQCKAKNAKRQACRLSRGSWQVKKARLRPSRVWPRWHETVGLQKLENEFIETGGIFNAAGVAGFGQHPMDGTGD